MTAGQVSAADIQAAAERLRGRVHRTPILTSRAIDRLTGCSVFFKGEHLQRGGAFKYRGALNAVLQLTDEEARRGVITHSSGNHAQAVAIAAAERGIPAHLIMPEDSLPVKIRAVRGYGGVVHLCPPTLADRATTAARVQAETGATFVHPYDHPRIIAGQAGVGLELAEQVSDLDAVIAPVGGGGLLSGVALALHHAAPHVTVFGAEPSGADDAARSLAAGQRLPQTDPRTIADGLRTGLGACNWPIIKQHVAGIITIDDDAIIAAMRLIWERLKAVIEPSAAVGLAALLAQPHRFDRQQFGGRVGIVLSGGNADLDRLPFGERVIR